MQKTKIESKLLTKDQYQTHFDLTFEAGSLEELGKFKKAYNVLDSESIDLYVGLESNYDLTPGTVVSQYLDNYLEHKNSGKDKKIHIKFRYVDPIKILFLQGQVWRNKKDQKVMIRNLL